MQDFGKFRPIIIVRIIMLIHLTGASTRSKCHARRALTCGKKVEVCLGLRA